MSDARYVLQVNYGDDEPALRITLPPGGPDEAELARQTLLHDVEHARALEAPLIYSAGTDRHPQQGVPIDPARVTGVDLVDAGPGEAEDHGARD